MATRRYEIYLRVLKNISQVNAFLFYYTKHSEYITTFVAIFRSFPNFVRRSDERFRTFSEVCRRRPKKIRRCFDNSATKCEDIISFLAGKVFKVVIIRDIGRGETGHSFLPSFHRFFCSGSRLRLSRKTFIHQMFCFCGNVSYSWIISALSIAYYVF